MKNGEIGILNQQRQRPERGAQPPNESAWGCRLRRGYGEPRRSGAKAGGPTRIE